MASFVLNFKRHFNSQKPFPDIVYDATQKQLIRQAFLKDCENLNGYHMAIGTHHPYLFLTDNHSSQKGWQRIVIELAANAAILLHLFSNPDGNKANADDSFSTVKQPNPAVSPFPVIKTINVRKTPLTEILDNNLPAGQMLRLLSIDVNGFDLRALKSNNWNKHRPLFIIIKSAPAAQTGLDAAVYHLLKKKNYEPVFKTPHICFFKLKQH